MKKLREFPNSLSSHLKHLRESAGVLSQGMTLEQAASAVDYSAAMLGNLEQGKVKAPPFTLIVSLARLYGVHPCGLTALYPLLTTRQQRAMEHFWTVLSDEQRDDIAGQIELTVDKNIRAGELSSPIVRGDLGPAFEHRRDNNHRQER